MSEENENPQSGGVQEEEYEPAQQKVEQKARKEIKAYYFYDYNQGSEYSENIIAVLLPSMNTFFIKKRIKGDQILIPLSNNRFLKLWKDSRGNLLYNITCIAQPLFTHLYTTKNISGGTKSIDEDGITITIETNNAQYEIKINEEFFKTVECSFKDDLALALYHLYISYII
jgi:hypothetical protein